MPAPELRLLLLGGTGEAAALARLLAERWGERLEIVSSLAGRTDRPGPLPGRVRIGGFGGTDGLTRYLREAAIDLVIDATHPFAETISAHAQEAADAAGLPRLSLVRPPWRRDPRDRWIEVADMAGAAAILPRVARRHFLSLGAGDLASFAGLELFFLLRIIDPLRSPPPFADYVALTGRGPFTIAGEEALLRHHRIEALVSRASGGADTEAKIIAARRLELPVVMIRRPVKPQGPRVESVAEAADWVGEFLADREARPRPGITKAARA